MRWTIYCCLPVVLSLGVVAQSADGPAQAGDAYLTRDGTSWTLGTYCVQKVVVLEDGKFLQRSYKAGPTGRELAPKGGADEFAFSLGDGGAVSSSSGGWKLVGSKRTDLRQGELRLDVILERDSLQVAKSYVVYPGSSIIREWLTFRNTGPAPVKVIEPTFLSFVAKTGDPSATEFYWMTGGENNFGSWKLITEALRTDKPRKFDSYESFPFYAVGPQQFLPGDGVNAKIMHNGKQVWPDSGWAFSANAAVKVPFDFTIDVVAGDKLIFQVNQRTNYVCDTTALDPTIAYQGGRRHTASAEFSGQQGRNGWKYQFIKGGQFVDMTFDAPANKWRREGSTDTPWISPGDQHPDLDQDAACVWIAPKTGRARVTGFVCNTGNGQAIPEPSYGFRPGTASYAPWNGLYSRDTKQGLFIGWDYFGHWASSFRRSTDGYVAVQYKIAGHRQTLRPGQSFTTPKAFVGLYRDDIDNAGNECLDWQYRYLWDYTREPWFPAIRMQGFWDKGTPWGQAGGKIDFDSTFRKVFRVADLMRYCGADVYHRDWGWWDKTGDWNGPDFRATHDYLKKYGMGQLIYAPLYTVVDGDSKVAREHPQWRIGGTLDMSKPEVVEFMKGQLDGFVAKWGNLTWRNDSIFTALRSGDDTVLLGQDQGFRKVIRDFLDQHEDCAFQGVNCGGNYGGYDYTRFSSSFSFSDGGVGPLRNYWAALIFPPDKTSDIPEDSPPYGYDKALWRGKLSINWDMYGDTWDPAKLEGVREMIDIYHYLQKHGVVGRWVKVYRPIVVGDPDPTMYFERLSGDRKRGIVIPKRSAPGPVTIKPKGLLPTKNYTVSFHECGTVEKRTGKDLMERGIQIERMPPGEIVYLNLPLHPGSKLDKEPPTPPTNATKQWGSNMGYPGVEIVWGASKDNNWISYYEIWRNGRHIDKLAKGTYYFDHSAGADLAAAYEIRAVDGADNVSSKTVANGPAAKVAKVYDDAPGARIIYTGQWKHQTGLHPAYEGTISSAGAKGTAAALTFEGRKVLWFSKLGNDCGKAAVSIDGAAPDVVDTYSADDIWGVCVYQKELPAMGRHTIRIEVLGQKGPRTKGTVVYLDGIQARPE